MKINTRTVDDVEIVALEGKITIGSGDIQLREVILQCMNEGKNNILLDMSGVSTLDSSGIGELVGYLGRFRDRQRKMILISPSDRIRKLLQVAHLDELFPTYDDLEAALAAEN